MNDSSMNSPGTRAASIVSEALALGAEDIVERWIDWLRDRVSTRSIRSLPKRGLRNHIPPVLRALASYVVNPVAAMRSEMIGHLRIHAHVRIDQGYSMEELLAEFDGLHGFVMDCALEALEGQEVAATEVGETVRRISSGLSAISHATVGLFEVSEGGERRELARQLEEFGNALAHELRNPLHTASIALQLLTEPDVREDPLRHRDAVRTIAKAIGRTADLVENVRLLAISEQVHAGQQHQRLDVLVPGIVEELAAAAAERGVEVRVVGEVPTLDVEVVPAQIALANLLSNAIKYSDPEKDERWVELRFERVDEDEKPLRARLTVEDNGLGIPTEFESRVFLRHFRAHPEAAEGTGLGLSLTSRLVRSRGGEIELSTEEGVGTTVAFTVRATDASAAPRSDPQSVIGSILQRAASEPDGPDEPSDDD